MTRDDIIKELKDKDIKFNYNAKKGELQELLDKANQPKEEEVKETVVPEVEPEVVIEDVPEQPKENAVEEMATKEETEEVKEKVKFKAHYVGKGGKKHLLGTYTDKKLMQRDFARKGSKELIVEEIK